MACARGLEGKGGAETVSCLAERQEILGQEWGPASGESALRVKTYILVRPAVPPSQIVCCAVREEVDVTLTWR
jgi:hypothetical protein